MTAREVGGGAHSLGQAQHIAYKLAQELVRRNQPGDRERAISELQKVFDEVFEVPA